MAGRVFDNLVAHVVWVVKLRCALLHEAGDDRLHTLLRTKANDLGARILAVGSASDHTPTVLRFPATVALSTVVGQLKGARSRAIGLDRPEISFAWQDGCWARSCDPGDLGALLEYVRAQCANRLSGRVSHPWEPEDS